MYGNLIPESSQNDAEMKQEINDFLEKYRLGGHAKIIIS